MLNSCVLTHLTFGKTRSWLTHIRPILVIIIPPNITINGALVKSPRFSLCQVMDNRWISSKLWSIIREMCVQGNTVILVTHEEDIAQYAHRIIRLKDGLIETDNAKS